MRLLFFSALVCLSGAFSSACSAAQTGGEVSTEEMVLLREGDLGAVQHSYESSASLNRAQRTVLCEIYIRQLAVGKAQACLDRLEQGADKDQRDVIAGKRALLAYLIADYREAVDFSSGLESLGGRYVYALASLRLGDRAPAIHLAARYGMDYAPEKVFLAANLYYALGDFQEVLTVLRRGPLFMDRDYSLAGNMTIFGGAALAAPLRVDLFGEFQGYGLFGAMSFAPPSNVYVEYLLAVAEAHTGETDSARERLERVLKYPGIDAYRELKSRAVAERARLKLAAGDRAGALADYELAVAGFDAVRSSIDTDAGRISFSGDKRDIYAALVRLLLAEGRADEAFEYSERFRSRALVDLMASVQTFGARGNLSGVEQGEALARLSAAEVSTPAIGVSRTGPGTDADEHAVAAAQTRAYLDQRKLALGHLDRTVREYVEVSDTHWREVFDALAPEELLISYYYDGEHWWAFVPREDDVKAVDLGALTHLDEDIKTFRAAMEAGNTADAQAVRLYQEILAPVKAAIGGKFPHRLTIIPFGDLHYIPFAALKREEGGAYFIEQEDLAIATLPAARIRQFLLPGGEARDGMLVIADPTRPDTTILDGALKELTLADDYSHSKKLPRADATRKAFIENAPSYGILHLAAHGMFDADNPIDSRILLAPDAANGDLTVSELFKIAPPWKARLVVLSACESALGRDSWGQELIGLQRGLLFAGAGSIVGSLWKIQDRGTYDFMQLFYRKLRDPGQTAPGALAATQRQMIQLDVNPKIWAAFTYTGIYE